MSWLDAAIEHSKGMGEGFSWETFGGRFFDSRRTRVYVPVKKGETALFREISPL